MPQTLLAILDSLMISCLAPFFPIMWLPGQRIPLQYFSLEFLLVSIASAFIARICRGQCIIGQLECLCTILLSVSVFISLLTRRKPSRCQQENWLTLTVCQALTCTTLLYDYGNAGLRLYFYFHVQVKRVRFWKSYILKWINCYICWELSVSEYKHYVGYVI